MTNEEVRPAADEERARKLEKLNSVDRVDFDAEIVRDLELDDQAAGPRGGQSVGGSIVGSTKQG